MHKQLMTDTSLDSLMALLDSKDVMVRQKARISLVAMGKRSVSALSRVLQHSSSAHARWASAKALSEICDVGSIPALIGALEDTDSDVAWLAALALQKMKKEAWRLLLQKLIDKGEDSVRLRRGVYHVFTNQHDTGFNDLLGELRDSLEDTAPPESWSLIAEKILKRIRSEQGDEV